MAQTITDFLSQPGPTGNLVPVVGVYVRLVDNATLTAYVSTAATDSKGAWTITGLPPGGYTVYTGPAATGPWTATGDANYVVGPNLDIAGIIPDSALSTNVALLAGAQTFTGPKTFSGGFTVSGGVVSFPAGSIAASSVGAIPESQVTNLVTDLASKAADAAVVHLAGAETVSGLKTFSGGLTVSAGAVTFPAASIAASMVGAIPESQVTNLTSDLAAKAADSLVVHLAGAETVSGLKTFSGGLTVSGGAVTLPSGSVAAAAIAPSGTNGQILTTQAGVASWQPAPASGVSSVSAGTGIVVTGTASAPIVGIAAGGVGQTQVANGYVDLSSTQTVGGAKTFSAGVTVTGAETIIQASTAAGLLIAGTGLYAGSPTDNAKGVAFALNYNAAGNRQLLFGDSTSFGLATDSLMRFRTGGTFIASIDVANGSGAGVRALNIGVSGGTDVAIGGDSLAPAATLPGKFVVYGDAVGKVTSIVRGYAAQTADLQQWQRSDGTVLASISAAGAPTFAQPVTLPLTSGGVVLGNAAGTTYVAWSPGQGWYFASNGYQTLYLRGAGPGAGQAIVEVITGGAAAGNDFAAFQVDAGTITMNASPSASGVVRFKQVTYSSTAAAQTAAVAATHIIEGPPIAGANYTITKPLALWVQAGGSQFDGTVGFNGTAPIAKPTVTGSKGANAALTSLMTALAAYGLVTDSTT